jgi:hypothetical protein
MLTRTCASAMLLVVSLAVGSCGSNPFIPTKPMTPEAYCAANFPSIGYGNFFYCGTSQSNLMVVNFPDGSHGFCASAQTNNIAQVGYIAYTYNGGIVWVESQSDASAQCSLFGRDCPGYLRCTRQ